MGSGYWRTQMFENVFLLPLRLVIWVDLYVGNNLLSDCCEEVWCWFSPHPALVRYTDIQHCISFRCIMYWSDTHICGKMDTIIALANTFVISHRYHFFLVVRTFQISSFGNLLVYKSVIWTVVTMLCVRSSLVLHPLHEGCLESIWKWIWKTRHSWLGFSQTALVQNQFYFFWSYEMLW